MVWSYRDFVLAHAVLAGQVGAERFVVGSELLSMEGERDRWLELIAATRAVFPGQLGYSANWDQYDEVTFWEAPRFCGGQRLLPTGEGTGRSRVKRSSSPLGEHLVALGALRDAVGSRW